MDNLYSFNQPNKWTIHSLAHSLLVCTRRPFPIVRTGWSHLTHYRPQWQLGVCSKIMSNIFVTDCQQLADPPSPFPPVSVIVSIWKTPSFFSDVSNFLTHKPLFSFFSIWPFLLWSATGIWPAEKKSRLCLAIIVCILFFL